MADPWFFARFHAAVTFMSHFFLRYNNTKFALKIAGQKCIQQGKNMTMNRVLF